MMRSFTLCFSILSSCLLLTAEEVKQFEPTGSTPYLSVEESLKTFVMPEGYRLEPVLTEPQIAEPVVCAFDGNGRLYVVEMRTYMQDADATGEQTKKSRVSLHEDTNGDGKMDKHSVFADNLLLPRMVLPLDDRVLIGETNTLDIYSYRDTDGDGVADEKKIFFKGGKRGGNMEHQPSGLIWSMDNWLYTTYNAFRLRFDPKTGEAIKEPTAPNGGQWGLTQDDHGKPWFVNGGGERGPVNIQQPIVYGAFNTKNQFEAGYREVFPLVGLPDVQGGTRRFRPENNTLNHFTSTCGGEIYRGDKLPAELKGDLLFSEPVGRLIRRSKVEVRDGITYLKNAHPGSEFIRSTDPNFRAMSMVTGPDGCLYIVDMYRGIIQQGNWTKRGSYLRGVIDEYGLDKNIQRGRIYRLVHDDFTPNKTKPAMLDQTPAELVSHLENPNGWWRDTAQKLMILSGDQTIVASLEKLTRESDSDLARMHAIWTLEGLGALSTDLLAEKFKDSEPSVRRTAIRAAETLHKSGTQNYEAAIKAMAKDQDPNVAIQALLTAKLLKFPDLTGLVAETMQHNPSAGVQEIGSQILSGGGNKAPRKLSSEQLAQFKAGRNIYASLCASCHGANGEGTSAGEDGLRLAPAFVNSKILNSHKDLATKVVLHGLTGPIDGKTYPGGQMIAMGSNGDKWVADVLSYINNSFGNDLGFISEEHVKRIRETSDRKTPWTEKELYASVPQTVPGRNKWHLTASHNEGDCSHAIDGNPKTRYTTKQSMKPGMWLQVELPEAKTISGIVMDAASSSRDYPRGCKIEFSVDGKNWSKPIKQKEDQKSRVVIEFPEQQAKYIKITQTGSNRLYWSIHDLQLLAPPAG